MSTQPLRAYGLVLAGAACLSFSAIVVKIAGVDAATTAFLRCAIAVVVLLPMAWAEVRREGRLAARGWWFAAAAGAALGVDYILWTESIFRVGAGIATVLINVQVLVLPLLALIVEREPIGRRFLWALPAMLIGIGLVGGLAAGAAGGRSGSAVAGSSAYIFGVVAGVIAGVCYGTYLYLSRRAGKVQPRLTVTQLCVATAAASASSALLSPLGSGLHLGRLTWQQWALMVVLAVVGQVISWLLIHRGSAGLLPRQTAALLLVQPVIALLLAAAILAERPAVSQWLGFVLVLAAVAVANRVIPLGSRS